ncbi:LOW QUALITY PROTEIN: uncharacterized protein [Panulirus ornatus]|uniref:LOW QUALITY PROTEIN: uncharacterized protein n=1 Tax=Panulirus ornatus TaxID=150431 RepID=UPI003A8A8995
MENQEANSAGLDFPARTDPGATEDQVGVARSGSPTRRSRKLNMSSRKSKFSRIRITGNLLHRLRMSDGEIPDAGDALSQDLLAYPATPIADVHSNAKSKSVDTTREASSNLESLSDFLNSRVLKSTGPVAIPLCGGTSSEDEGISDLSSSVSPCEMKNSGSECHDELHGEHSSSASLEWSFEEPVRFTQDAHVCSSSEGLMPSSLDLDLSLDIQEGEAEPISSSSSTSSDSGAGVSPDLVTEEGAIRAVTHCFSWLDGEIFALEPHRGSPDIEASDSSEEEEDGVTANQILQCDGRDSGHVGDSCAPQESTYSDADEWEVDEEFEFTGHSSVEVSQGEEVLGDAAEEELDGYIDECFEWFDGESLDDDDDDDGDDDAPASQHRDDAHSGNLADAEYVTFKEEKKESLTKEGKESHREEPGHGREEGEAKEKVEEEKDSTALGQAVGKSEALLVCDSGRSNVWGCSRLPRADDDTQLASTAGTGNQNYDCGLRTWVDTADVGKESHNESLPRCSEGCGENDGDSHGSLSESEWSDAATCILRESHTPRPDSDIRASDSDWDDSDVSSEDTDSEAQRHSRLREPDDVWEGHGVPTALNSDHKVRAAYPPSLDVDPRLWGGSCRDSSTERRESYISSPLHSSNNWTATAVSAPLHCGDWTDAPSSARCGKWTEDAVSPLLYADKWTEDAVSPPYSDNWTEDAVSSPCGNRTEDAASSPFHSASWTEDDVLDACKGYHDVQRDMVVPHSSGTCLGCLVERDKDVTTQGTVGEERRTGVKGPKDKYYRPLSHEDDGWIDCENRRWYKVGNTSFLARNDGSHYVDVVGMSRKQEGQVQNVGVHSEDTGSDDEGEHVRWQKMQRKVGHWTQIDPWNEDLSDMSHPSGSSCTGSNNYQAATPCHPWMPTGESLWYNGGSCCIRPGVIALQNRPSCENNFNNKSEGYTTTNHPNECWGRDHLHCKICAKSNNSFVYGESGHEYTRNHSGSEGSNDAYDSDIGEDSDTGDSSDSDKLAKNSESCVNLARQTNDSLDLLSQYRRERERKDQNRRRSRVKSGGGSYLRSPPGDGTPVDVNIPSALTNEQIAHMERKNGSMRGRSYIFLRPFSDIEDEDNEGTNTISPQNRKRERLLPNYRHDSGKDVSSTVRATLLTRATPCHLSAHGDAPIAGSHTYSSPVTGRVRNIHDGLFLDENHPLRQRRRDTTNIKDIVNTRGKAMTSEMAIGIVDNRCLGGARQCGLNQRSGMAYGSTHVCKKNNTSNGFGGGSVLDGASSGVLVHSITAAASRNSECSTVSDSGTAERNPCWRGRYHRGKWKAFPQSDVMLQPGMYMECTCLPDVLVGIGGGGWGASGVVEGDQQRDGHPGGHPCSSLGRDQHVDARPGWPAAHTDAGAACPSAYSDAGACWPAAYGDAETCWPTAHIDAGAAWPAAHTDAGASWPTAHTDAGASRPAAHSDGLPFFVPSGSRALHSSVAYPCRESTPKTKIAVARPHVSVFDNNSSELEFGVWRQRPPQTLSTTCHPPSAAPGGGTSWDDAEGGIAGGREENLTSSLNACASGERSRDRIWSSFKLGSYASGMPSDIEPSRVTNDRTCTSVYLGNRPIPSTGLEEWSSTNTPSPVSQQRRLFIPASCLSHSICTRYPLYKKIQDVLCHNTTGLTPTDTLPHVPDVPVQTQPRSLLKGDLIRGGDSHYEVKGHWENKVITHSPQRVITHGGEPHPPQEADVEPPVNGDNPGWTRGGQVSGSSSTLDVPHSKDDTATLTHREPPDGTATPSAPVGKFLQKLSELLPFNTHVTEDPSKLCTNVDFEPAHKHCTVENNTRSVHKDQGYPDTYDTTVKGSTAGLETQPVWHSTTHGPVIESHEYHPTPHLHTTPSLQLKPQGGPPLITTEPQVDLPFLASPLSPAELDENVLSSSSDPEKDPFWANLSPFTMSQPLEKFGNSPETPFVQELPKNQWCHAVQRHTNSSPTKSEPHYRRSSVYRPPEKPSIFTVEPRVPYARSPREKYQSSIPEPYENTSSCPEPPDVSHLHTPVLFTGKLMENPQFTSPDTHDRLTPTCRAMEKSLSPVAPPSVTPELHRPQSPPTREPQMNSPSTTVAQENNLLPSPASGSRPAKSIIPESANQQSSVLLVVDPPTAANKSPSLVDLMKLGSYDGYITLPVTFTPGGVSALGGRDPASHENSSQREISECLRETRKESDPDVSISTQVRVSLRKFSRRRKNGSRKLVIKFTLCLGK